MLVGDKIVKTENRKSFRVKIFDDRKTIHDIYDLSGFFEKKVSTAHNMKDVLAWVMATTGSEIGEIRDR
ncbi:MAG: hypothetical protein L3J67_00900 [Hyphomicrobiaceae bacterium]|nr:hypothetical protein [Hyphomicrobiaceae bacterium]